MNAQQRRQRQQQEVDTNYAVIQSRLAELTKHHAGEFALMKDREIVAFFSTRGDAITAGNKLFEDRVFSVNAINDDAVDLGFYSCF